MSTQEAVSRTPLPHQTGQCLPTPTPARSFPPSLPLSRSASHPLPLTFSLALGFGTKAWPSLDTLSLSFLARPLVMCTRHLEKTELLSTLAW